jgi:hypothetical protein
MADLADQTSNMQVSGNIEADQSGLGFKTVQSRIVELPFKKVDGSKPAR